MKLQIQSLVLMVFLAGCGTGGGSGGNGPSGDPKNSKITGVASGAFSGQTALFEAGNTMGRGKAGTGNNQILATLVLDSSTANLAPDGKSALPPDGKSAMQKKGQTLGQSLQSSQCKIDLPKAENQNKSLSGAAGQFPPMHMKISGSACPIEMNLEIEIAGADGAGPCKESSAATVCKFKASVKMNYRVLDDKLAKELEVRSGNINMAFEIEQSLPGTQSPEESINIKTNMKAAFDLRAVDLDGHAHLISGNQNLKTQTTIAIAKDGQASVPQIFGGIEEDLQYLQEPSGASSKLKATVTLNGRNGDGKFFVDGLEVTEKVFTAERDKFANSMMSLTKEQDDQPTEQQEPSTSEPHQPGRPAPSPAPVPLPGPVPRPLPQPQPSNPTKWACMTEDYSTKNVFIGYGSDDFVAQSKAKQACQALLNAKCSSVTNCEEQEIDLQAWYCEGKK